MTRIAIDPITRIEGHLRIEVEIENGVVKAGSRFQAAGLFLHGTTVAINTVNDAPTLTGATLAAVAEDTANPPGQTVATIFSGKFSDPDLGAFLAGLAVVGNTADAGTQGTWQYSSNAGANWFAIGAVGDGPTALAVSAGTLVRFAPAANFNGPPPSLVVRALDNSYAGGFSSTAGSETRISVDTGANGGATAIAAGRWRCSSTATPRSRRRASSPSRSRCPSSRPTRWAGRSTSS